MIIKNAIYLPLTPGAKPATRCRLSVAPPAAAPPKREEPLAAIAEILQVDASDPAAMFAALAKLLETKAAPAPVPGLTPDELRKCREVGADPKTYLRLKLANQPKKKAVR